MLDPDGRKMVRVVVGLVGGALFFVCLLGLIVSYDPASKLENAWNQKKASWQDQADMSSCKDNLQADLEEFWGPDSDPTVTKCSGIPEKATCLVKSLENGTYKTFPFVANCSKRHFEQGIKTKARTAEEEKRWEGQKEAFWRDFQGPLTRNPPKEPEPQKPGTSGAASKVDINDLIKQLR